jgi:hypothetical protein
VTVSVELFAASFFSWCPLRRSRLNTPCNPSSSSQHQSVARGFVEEMSQLPPGTLLSASAFSGSSPTALSPYAADARFVAPAVAAAALFVFLQLAIWDSPLSISFQRLIINGTFTMGTPACPIASSITVNVPGGNELFGVDNAGSYDVHGVMQVRTLFVYVMWHVTWNGTV